MAYRGRMVSDEVEALVHPERVFSRNEVLSRPSPVPTKDGIYAWWFRRLPPLVAPSHCCRHQDLTLLYAGISPDRPKNGRLPSRQNLLNRIKYHYTGNAEGSTLRKTLGCLLAAELGIELRRVGSGKRMTFVEGERALSAWMAGNAYVSWVVRQQPWELEDQVIEELDLPLNLMGNKHNQFHSVLTEVRAKSVERARDLPVLPNPGTGGR